jgi:beta-glucosidase
VLLRNDGTLPLRADVGTIAVIGPCADGPRNLFGDYAYPAHVESLRVVLESGQDPFAQAPIEGLDFDGVAAGVPSVLDAFREKLGSRVRFARGCDVNGASREGFAEAVALAQESDVAVLVMGDKSGLTDDCTSGETRDRASLDLPGVQEELVEAVAATGTPVVLVLVAGRPCGSASLHERCAAALLAWLPGQEGAGAIADTIVGEVSPGGKLPVSYPHSSGQIPVFYGHKVTGGRSHWKGDYVDAPAAPLYPFGHGLGFTTFELAEHALAETEVSWNDAIVASVTVSNSGDRAGEEVVQLYVRDPQASVTRPVLELKGFVRVELDPGESRRITFSVPAGQLGFHGRDLDYVVEPGRIDVFVGTSSAEVVPVGAVTVVADAEEPQKAFDGSVSVE